jgi:2'-5' RNA ligase
MRLFVAIPFDDVVQLVLDLVAQRLAHQAVAARPVPRENFHLTLVFIGECSRVDDVRAVLRDTCSRFFSEPIALNLLGIGSFKQRKGHTWWAGVDATQGLEQLVLKMSSALRAAGFSIENRVYKPHVTLARGVVTTRPIELELPPLEVLANEVCLMRSDSANDRMVYTCIDSWQAANF